MAWQLEVMAPAKINWTLEVLGRRPDGYHDVCTVMQTVSLWDRLQVGPAPALKVRCEGPFPVEDTLVTKAAGLIGGPPVEVTVYKGIPPASGLGGGSSDAAAALLALSRLSSPLPQEKLIELAGQIGEDVPFFLVGGTALVMGRGRHVTPLPDAPTVWLVLVVPPFQLTQKTARMYGLLTPALYSDGTFTRRFLGRLAEGVIDENCMYNAFERVAYSVFPELARYRAALLQGGARRVHLAGSGPALFALASCQEEAQELASRSRIPEGNVYLVRTLSRQEVLHG